MSVVTDHNEYRSEGAKCVRGRVRQARNGWDVQLWRRLYVPGTERSTQLSAERRFIPPSPRATRTPDPRERWRRKSSWYKNRLRLETSLHLKPFFIYVFLLSIFFFSIFLLSSTRKKTCACRSHLNHFGESEAGHLDGTKFPGRVLFSFLRSVTVKRVSMGF